VVFQGHLRKYYGLFCANVFTRKAPLEFLAAASMAGLRVKGLKGRGEGNEKRRTKRKKMSAIKWRRKIKRKERKGG
jgi:hypothetical protein